MPIAAVSSGTGQDQSDKQRRTVSTPTLNCLASLRRLVPPSWYIARILSPHRRGDLRTADGLAALGAALASPPHAGPDALGDHGALELGEHAHHLEHGAARRRRGVKSLLVQVKLDVAGVDFAQERTRSCSERPSLSTDQAMMMSSRRRVASRHKRSNAGRSSRPWRRKCHCLHRLPPLRGRGARPPPGAPAPGCRWSGRGSTYAHKGRLS